MTRGNLKRVENISKQLIIFGLVFCVISSGLARSKKTILLSNYQIANNSDITTTVKDVLENLGDEPTRLVFPKGTYHFSADKAYRKFHNITNHDSGQKNIAFYLNSLKNIEIDGQDSEFIFHGEIMPFLLQDCQNIQLKNFSIDWEIPFYIQGEVVKTNAEKCFVELEMFQEGFSYRVEANRIKFPIDKNVQLFTTLGESLAFDKHTKSPVYNANAYDMHRNKDVQAELLPSGNIILNEKLKDYPPLNSVLVFKGKMGENRYAPAFHCLRSKNILVQNVNVFHVPGMGFLGEKSENITLHKFNVKLRDGTNRYVSATADATHFASCRGKVLLDSCILENMLDDGTNVHGTYLEIDSVINNRTVVADLKHFQQAGFIFAEKDDWVWFLTAPSSSRTSANKVTGVKKRSESTFEISFKSALPPTIKKGDLLENKTDNTSRFIMQNCTVRNHRARNVVLKAPGKILIQNNYFQSMMASILIRGEACMWYESGAVENVVIRNNYFENCVLGGGKQAVLHISPKFNIRFDTQELFDKNIVFKNNTIKTFDTKIVDASRVNRIKIVRNKILETNLFTPFYPSESLIDIQNCRNAVIKQNSYTGNHKLILKIDSVLRKSAVFENN